MTTRPAYLNGYIFRDADHLESLSKDQLQGTWAELMKARQCTLKPFRRTTPKPEMVASILKAQDAFWRQNDPEVQKEQEIRLTQRRLESLVETALEQQAETLKRMSSSLSSFLDGVRWLGDSTISIESGQLAQLVLSAIPGLTEKGDPEAILTATRQMKAVLTRQLLEGYSFYEQSTSPWANVVASHKGQAASRFLREFDYLS